MNEQTKAKVREQASGIKKVSEKQADAIKKLYETKDPKFSEVEKLVHKSVLYKITGNPKYAPKTGKSEKALKLNEILFS